MHLWDDILTIQQARHIKSKQSQNKFQNHAASKLPAVTTVCGRTIVLSQELSSPFTSIQSTNEEWISTTTEDARNMFQQFKKVDETIDPYLHLLKLLIVNTKDEDVIDVIVSFWRNFHLLFNDALLRL